MRTVQAVAWKEILVYFGSPMAYIVGLIFLTFTGVAFVWNLGDPFPEASLNMFFFGATIILILLAPALTMRLLAEEQKLGTIELLLTSPVRDWEVIIGKYLASLAFLMAMIAMTLYYPLLLLIFAQPDPGPLYSGYLGLILYFRSKGGYEPVHLETGGDTGETSAGVAAAPAPTPAAGPVGTGPGGTEA